jgi:hypothetical protein
MTTILHTYKKCRLKNGEEGGMEMDMEAILWLLVDGRFGDVKMNKN